MTTRILTVLMMAAIACLAGCAADLRLGDQRHGVGAGASIGSPGYSPAP